MQYGHLLAYGEWTDDVEMVLPVLLRVVKQTVKHSPELYLCIPGGQ